MKGSVVVTRLATNEIWVAGFLQATIGLDTGFPCARAEPCGWDCCKVWLRELAPSASRRAACMLYGRGCVAVGRDVR